MRKYIIYILLLAIGSAAVAQQPAPLPKTDTTDLSEMSLEQLNRLKSRYVATDMEKTIALAIEAASRNPLTVRKTPSIVTVITDNEIEKSGARDLMDVLKMVPGIQFNIDVQGVVGISFRGLWANEGNLSLLIDGQELNESAYSSLQFGQHYDIHQIKRIEVIRGPGSALYGGSAEYAVINIMTKRGNEINGIQANVTGSGNGSGVTGQQVGVLLGQKIKELTYSVCGMYGTSQRSNFNYTDVGGKGFNMYGNSGISDAWFNTVVSYKNFVFKFIYDDYKISTRDGYLYSLTQPYPCNFKSSLVELRHKLKFSKDLQLQSKLNFKSCVPWEFNGHPAPVDSAYGFYRIITDRLKLNVLLNWDPKKWVNVNVGAEAIYDHGRKPDGQQFNADHTNNVSYMNYAPFAQLLFNTRIANIIAGARYDISTAFGSAFNPRLAITKKVGIANFKLLYASSFRAPSIENIQYSMYNTKLKPETSQTYELESSFKISKDMFLSLNLFDITTYNAIHYYVKRDSVMSGDPDGYRNTTLTTGSRGLELEYKWKNAWGFASVSYSYYTVGDKNVDSANMVACDRSATLGIAQHKVSLSGSFNAGSYFYISPSALLLGHRFGIASLDVAKNAQLTEFKPQVAYNIYVGSEKLARNLTTGIGLYNITNEKTTFIQAYNSLHAPLPGMGRELFLNLKYDLKFSKPSLKA